MDIKANNLSKVPTQISSLDDILQGGLPRGRTTLISGAPGIGKSILALEIIYRGAMAGKPGIFLSFEERAANIRLNARTLGWDLEALEKQGKLALIEARVDPGALISGEFSIKGLLSIVEGQSKKIGAARVVFDALDVLMRLFDDPNRERNEIYALNDWLLDHEMTAIITVKAAEDGAILPRYGFLEFMADCVILLSRKPTEQSPTRQLQVIKFRGSGFGGNTYPFVIEEGGVKLLPLSTYELQHQPLGSYVSTGNPRFDEMLGGGFRRASSILVTGTSGTGKSTFASTFALFACERGEKVLFVSYEESAEALISSMLSPGIDLRPAVKSAKLRIITSMPEALSTEQHLIKVLKNLNEFKPDHVIVDAISSAKRMGSEKAAFEYAMCLVNECKKQGITILINNQGDKLENVDEISGMGISSIIDTVVLLRYVKSGGEINRTLLVMKSRGSPHSNQFREFRITDQGIKIADIYTGDGVVVTGTARLEQDTRQEYEERRRLQEIKQKEYEIAQKKAHLKAEAISTHAELERAQTDLEALQMEEKFKKKGRIERSETREANTKNNSGLTESKPAPPRTARQRKGSQQ